MRVLRGSLLLLSLSLAAFAITSTHAEGEPYQYTDFSATNDNVQAPHSSKDSSERAEQDGQAGDNKPDRPHLAEHGAHEPTKKPPRLASRLDGATVKLRSGSARDPIVVKMKATGLSRKGPALRGSLILSKATADALQLGKEVRWSSDVPMHKLQGKLAADQKKQQKVLVVTGFTSAQQLGESAGGTTATVVTYKDPDCKQKDKTLKINIPKAKPTQGWTMLGSYMAFASQGASTATIKRVVEYKLEKNPNRKGIKLLFRDPAHPTKVMDALNSAREGVGNQARWMKAILERQAQCLDRCEIVALAYPKVFGFREKYNRSNGRTTKEIYDIRSFAAFLKAMNCDHAPYLPAHDRIAYRGKKKRATPSCRSRPMGFDCINFRMQWAQTQHRRRKQGKPYYGYSGVPMCTLAGYRRRSCGD